MTEEKANNLLREKEEQIFTSERGRVIYAAVVPKKGSEIAYQIEIGIKTPDETFLFDTLSEEFPDELLRVGIPEQIIANYKNIKRRKGTDVNLIADFGRAERNFIKLGSPFVDRVNQDIFDMLGFPSVKDDNDEKASKITFSGGFEFLGQCSEYPNERHNVYNKICGGISISDIERRHTAGTLGCLFSLQNSNEVYGITNSHVLPYADFEANKGIAHPALMDSRTSKPKRVIGELMAKWDKNIFDVAIFKLTKPETPMGIFAIGVGQEGFEIGAAEIGQVSGKSGRTTSVTWGNVLSKNAVVNLRNGRFMRDLILTDTYSDCGDSGSVLYTDEQEVIGLIFGRSMKSKRVFAIKMENIFNCGHKLIDGTEIIIDKFLT
ncbi:trypsin-like peptidase domain-containing protein [Gilvibacter sediminis]|uniref:trypsin-like peptidase domain-containing protein n=1 Tax=Gilvibacter sediminis TaxID=379071 RepID=UPI0023500D95|nr:trypsin-like peptidase domain-containing protein [Gilvibacter sediminis]MDC7999323.1 hypothetical protein [Gilvibacter sediminis]